MNTQLEELLAKFRIAEFPEFLDVVLDNPFVRSPWSGDALLHFVAVWGDVDAARLLIDAGVEIDLPGEHDFTALHEAVSQDHPAMVSFLLSRGADPARKTTEFGDAFEIAARKKDPEISQILNKNRPT